MEPKIPLLEVVLELQFDPIEAPSSLPIPLNSSTTCHLTEDTLELRSQTGMSFPKLRDEWEMLLHSLLSRLQISVVNSISLAYLNEIALQDLRDFQDYLNIGFRMPDSLKERFEFFRSEFTYKSDFGEVRVWLQPDWDDRMEAYCIQLNLESRRSGEMSRDELIPKISELHEGNKEIFRQILAESYVRQLPS